MQHIDGIITKSAGLLNEMADKHGFESAGRLLYAIHEGDIQDAAKSVLGRKLTPQELQDVADQLSQNIDFGSIMYELLPRESVKRVSKLVKRLNEVARPYEDSGSTEIGAMRRLDANAPPPKKPVRVAKITPEVADIVSTLMASCREGLSGEWDTSTDEGREGFDAMLQDLEKLSKLLGITASAEAGRKL